MMAQKRDVDVTDARIVSQRRTAVEFWTRVSG